MKPNFVCEKSLQGLRYTALLFIIFVAIKQSFNVSCISLDLFIRISLEHLLPFIIGISQNKLSQRKVGVQNLLPKIAYELQCKSSRDGHFKTQMSQTCS